MKYSMLIQWSDEDGVYVVSFPEFKRGPMIHGTTYAQAAKRGAQVLADLVADLQEVGVPLPAPDVYSVPNEP